MKVKVKKKTFINWWNMLYKDYTWAELLELRPIIEDNRIIIIHKGIKYEARLRVNERWRLHEIK